MCAQVPTKCTAVPDEILNPAAQWSNKAEFDKTLKLLATLYQVSRHFQPEQDNTDVWSLPCYAPFRAEVTIVAALLSGSNPNA